MSKLPRDKRDKIILVTMGTLIAAAGIWFAVIRAQGATLDGVRKEKVAAEAQVQVGQKTLKETAAVEKDFTDSDTALKTCETGMASPTDMFSWFTQTINAFRLGYQVEIPQFSRETPSEVGTFAKFPYRAALFTVRGSGSYHDFGKFLAAFENAFPYIRVQNIELTPFADVASNDTSEKVTFKMELLTLVRPTAP